MFLWPGPDLALSIIPGVTVTFVQFSPTLSGPGRQNPSSFFGVTKKMSRNGEKKRSEAGHGGLTADTVRQAQASLSSTRQSERQDRSHPIRRLSLLWSHNRNWA